jgi:tetraacyldisaccharide 4'-kinase
MRESLTAGLGRADAVAITGEDHTELSQLIEDIRPGMTVARVPRHLDKKSLAPIRNKPVIAFSGIGDNDGFFAMLDKAGISLLDRIAFADHHPFSDAEMTTLRDRAADEGAMLVTTEKDKVRLGPRSEGIIAAKLIVEIPDPLLDKILPRR